MESLKVYMSTVRCGLVKGVIVKRDNGVVWVKITSRGSNAYPYEHGMIVETRPEFLKHR